MHISTAAVYFLNQLCIKAIFPCPEVSHSFWYSMFFFFFKVVYFKYYYVLIKLRVECKSYSALFFPVPRYNTVKQMVFSKYLLKERCSY